MQPVAWNHKPVVVYHPEGPTACTPEILSAHKVGVVMNARYDNGLKAEAWLEEHRLQAVDERVLNAINSQEMMEVSTGVFIDFEPVDDGVWNNEEYIGAARDIVPDHLAILPDIKGACSIEDGAGLVRNNMLVLNSHGQTLRLGKAFTESILPLLDRVGIDTSQLQLNELSHDQLRRQLFDAVQQQHGDDAWVEEVYDDHVIYDLNGQLYEQNYDVAEDIPQLSGLPVAVQRVVQYVKASDISEEIVMDKKKIIDALIANAGTQWNEEDRAVLEAMDDATLNKLVPVEIENNEDDEDGSDTAEEQVSGVTNETPAPKTPVNLKEFLSQAPPEIRNVLTNSLKTYDATKTRLINTIMANSRNKFTEKQLKAKDVDELTMLAELAAPEEDEDTGIVTYEGLQETVRVANDEEPLSLPGSMWGDEE